LAHGYMGTRSERPLIILVTGDAASGKSSFCRKVRRAWGPRAKVVNVGELLRARLEAERIEPPAVKARIGPLFIDEFGKDEIAAVLKKAVKDLIQQPTEIVIVDGIRLEDTYSKFFEFVRESSCYWIHVHINTPKSENEYRIRCQRTRIEREHLRETMGLEARYDKDLARLRSRAEFEYCGSNVDVPVRKFLREVQLRGLSSFLVQARVVVPDSAEASWQPGWEHLARTA
jgi:hypothetical protein